MLFVVIGLLVVALATVLAISIGQSVSQLAWNSPESLSSSQVCTTPSCINAANSLIQNMDSSVNPCEDFYQYACGGFLDRVRIPDDQSSRSQFGIIDDELEEQLRDILESNVTDDESKVFQQARDQYQACMNLPKLEEIGLKPVTDILQKYEWWQ